MKAIKNEFPNPVLAEGRDDYIDSCSFHTFFEEQGITIDNENILIPVTYDLKCNGLQELVMQQKATVAVLVKSSAASYSKLFRFAAGKTDMVISIPKFAVVNKIDIYGAVIAACNMDHFRCEGEFNDLYFGTSTFEIRKGDILATEDPRTIFVDDSELEKPIASIFTISKYDDQSEDIIPYFLDHKIDIRLKSEIYDLYFNFKDFNNGALRRYIAGIVVYPVLVEAITIIAGYYQNEDDDEGVKWDEYRWFRAIEHKANNLGIDMHNFEDRYTTLANKLLGNICLDSLKSFKDTLDEEVNSGETQRIGGED